MQVKCLIDFCVNDQRSSVLALVDRLDPAIAKSESDELVIDLEKCQYLGPDGAAILATIVQDLKHQGRRVRISSPAGPYRLRAYWHFCGLEKIASGEHVSPGFADDEGYPVLPLSEFRKARFQDADPMIRMLQRYGTLPADFDEYLSICVNEVIQNIQDHANSPIGGLMTARFMEKAKEVRVAIADRGDGICTTLRRKHPDTNAGNALRRVLAGEYSALSRDNNQGLGLSNLAAIIRRLRGDLFILSEDSAVEMRRDGWGQYHELPSRFQGTGVFFTLPVRG